MSIQALHSGVFAIINKLRRHSTIRNDSPPQFNNMVSHALIGMPVGGGGESACDIHVLILTVCDSGVELRSDS